MPDTEMPTFLLPKITTEHALIGCASIGPADVRQSCGWLAPEAFDDTNLGTFWREFLAGRPPMEIAIELKLWQYDSWPQWEMAAGSWTYAPLYAKEIAEAAQLRSMNVAVARLTVATGAGDYATAMQQIQELAKRTPVTAPNLRTAIDAGADFLASLDAPVTDILTHIPPLDNALGGLELQNMSVLAARPSMGKSALAWQIARTVAHSGRKVVFASIEMSERDLFARAACGAVGVSYRDVRHRRVTAAQRTQVEQVCSDIMYQLGPNLVIEHDSNLSTADLWRIVGLARPALVVADHIGLFSDKSDANENQRLGDITWNLKRMAKDFDCHVLAVAQLSRKTEMRAESERRPQLADLRDSGEIEQNADIVMMLYREGYYRPEKETNTHAPSELWLRKNRNGPSNDCVKLNFRKIAQWFEAPTKGDPR